MACDKQSAAGSVSQRLRILRIESGVYPIADAVHLVHGRSVAPLIPGYPGALSSGPELHR